MLPEQVNHLLKRASAGTPHQGLFTSSVYGGDCTWDRFIEIWAERAYLFLLGALGSYHKQPLRSILPMSEAAHISGANASFEPDTGQIRLHPGFVRRNPGKTLEKVTHELLHANLNNFPEGDPFYEEGCVDYSILVLAHAPVWEPYKEAMIKAAISNIECRRERALKTQTDYDRKRWAGGLFTSMAYGPHIISRLRQKKLEGDLTW